MKFVRYGGLSGRRQRGYNPNAPTMHSPPANKGIYAFPEHLIERFLLGGTNALKDKSEKYFVNGKADGQPMVRRRTFDYNGEIWHHLPAKIVNKQSGTWYLSPMHSYEEALRRELHTLCSDSLSKGQVVRSGLTGYYSKDHLEVFIEKTSGIKGKSPERPVNPKRHRYGKEADKRNLIKRLKRLGYDVDFVDDGIQKRRLLFWVDEYPSGWTAHGNNTVRCEQSVQHCLSLSDDKLKEILR